MKVKVFLEEGAILPKKAHDSDYCYDVYAKSREIKNGVVVYGTGLHTSFPSHVPNTNIAVSLNPFARSGIADTGLILSNGIGVVDSGYRGEIKGKFYQVCAGVAPIYDVGERFMQIALSTGEDIEWEVVNSIEELGESDRDGGFNSTGRK